MDSLNPPPGDEHRPPQTPVQKPKRTRNITSSELFAEAQEVQIEHAGEMYRLRKTRTGKLILTK